MWSVLNEYSCRLYIIIRLRVFWHIKYMASLLSRVVQHAPDRLRQINIRLILYAQQ